MGASSPMTVVRELPMPAVPPAGVTGLPAAASRVGLEQLVLELAATNAQLTERYEQQLALESRLRRVATGMHRVLDIDAILSFGVAELVDALGERAVVYRLGTDGSAEVLAQYFDETVEPIRELGGVTLPRQVHEQAWRLASRQLTSRVPDVAADRLLDPATRAHLADIGVKALLAGSIQLVEDEVLLVSVQRVSGPCRWSDDARWLFEGILREITTALRNATALEQQLAALRARQDLDRDKDAFVSNVSHELRTPLTSVLGYLELLRDEGADGLSDQQQELLAVVERNAGRLLTLIEDLLLLSTVQSEDRTPVSERVRIDEVAGSAVETLRPAARDRRLSLTTRLPPSPVVVVGDPVELERALLNLLVNAVKFTSPGGNVALDVEVADRLVRLRVSDDGVGIPEEEQSRLFERFYRGSAAQRGAVTGSGLGLAITHRIVERHQGRVEVRSQAGKGTTVVVELPLAIEDHHPASSDSGSASSSRSIAARRALATNGFVR